VFVLTASDDHVLHRPASGYLLGLAVVYRLIVYVLLAREVLRVTVTSSKEPPMRCGRGTPAPEALDR
jgi:hypothetical protein